MVCQLIAESTGSVNISDISSPDHGCKKLVRHRLYIFWREEGSASQQLMAVRQLEDSACCGDVVAMTLAVSSAAQDLSTDGNTAFRIPR